jgi:ABC-type uncharacterized transport system auxiliary subunit
MRTTIVALALVVTLAGCMSNMTPEERARFQAQAAVLSGQLDALDAQLQRNQEAAQRYIDSQNRPGTFGNPLYVKPCLYC